MNDGSLVIAAAQLKRILPNARSLVRIQPI